MHHIVKTRVNSNCKSLDPQKIPTKWSKSFAISTIVTVLDFCRFPMVFSSQIWTTHDLAMVFYMFSIVFHVFSMVFRVFSMVLPVFPMVFRVFSMVLPVFPTVFLWFPSKFPSRAGLSAWTSQGWQLQPMPPGVWIRHAETWRLPHTH